MSRLTFSHERTDHGARRAYYIASAPARAVVVFRDGLEASKMIGDVVEVSVTTAVAPSGLARPGNAGKPHTVISVLRRVDTLAEQFLWYVIEGGKQDEESE